MQPGFASPLPAEDTTDRRRGAGWKFALLGALSESTSPRIFTAAGFLDFVQRFRPGASASTARSAAQSLTAAGALRVVSSGLLLNRRAMPPAEWQEAAAHIRAGAIISLHSVLGEVGFLNNPSAVVVAVLPSSAAKRPRLGEVRTSGGQVFRFYGLAERFFPKSQEQRFEMLQPGRYCEMFRPEAALLQWLHLAGMQRSSLTPPPWDVDMEALDRALLDRLAASWRLTTALAQWLAAAEAADFGQEPETQGLRASAPSPKALDAAAAAKARMLRKRPLRT